MFTYGSLLGLAERYNGTVILSSGHYDYLARIFNLSKFYFVDDNACLNKDIFSIWERWPSRFDANVQNKLSQFLKDLQNNVTIKLITTESQKNKMFKINFDKNYHYPIVKIFHFLQSWRYFENTELRSVFRFQTWIDSSVQIILQQRTKEILLEKRFPTFLSTFSSNLTTSSENSFKSHFISFEKRKFIHLTDKKIIEVVYIGVHIRRRDMTNPNEIRRGYLSAPKEYIDRAIQLFESEFLKWGNDEFKKLTDRNNWVDKTLVFIVSSDDVQWASQNVKSSYPIIYTHELRSRTFNLTSTEEINLMKKFASQKLSMGVNMFDTAVDLAILSACQHVIMTVGTFGWWAGFLSGGTVVYYKNYPSPNTEIGSGFLAEDYYPPNWISMT
ncbi:hypothetical protein HELRODRAFT_110149 [Helobdella robusta]|uniref:L-Fucosyltransferase n=1 Tax=Helobdella robusta TaxID=6412 RepID=T1EEZ9_HELRO|nr:hypothetical protein HELRODRAFT_110149 [Helobdella robusta]ESO08600.1 hypothetical protein HELRODRAFT_110149 [Helobdella robusta]